MLFLLYDSWILLSFVLKYTLHTRPLETWALLLSKLRNCKLSGSVRVGTRKHTRDTFSQHFIFILTFPSRFLYVSYHLAFGAFPIIFAPVCLPSYTFCSLPTMFALNFLPFTIRGDLSDAEKMSRVLKGHLLEQHLPSYADSLCPTKISGTNDKPRDPITPEVAIVFLGPKPTLKSNSRLGTIGRFTASAGTSTVVDCLLTNGVKSPPILRKLRSHYSASTVTKPVRRKKAQ